MFKNKIVLITGSSKNIGKSIALKFVKKNAIVIATTSNINNINYINNYLNGSGFCVYLDLNNIDSINNLFYIIKNKFNNGIDILINNSSFIIDKLLFNINEHELNYMFNVNLLSVFRITKYFIKFMMKKKFGRIISIGSIIGSIGNIGQTIYSSSKSGLIGFTKSLSKEVSKYGITVNIISPGFIKTNITNKLKKKIKYKFLNKIDMKRFGNINEVVNVIIFIASKYSSYITGEIINVNGGM